MYKFFDSIYIVKKLDQSESDLMQMMVARIREAAELYGLNIVTDLKLCDRHTLFIVAGGDGTMLEGMKYTAIYGGAVIGFNLGKRGFLTDFSPDNINLPIQLAVQGELKTIGRSLLNVTVPRDAETEKDFGILTFTALNDCVISHLYSDTIIRYQVFSGDSSAGKHASNSIILSTPTGSTAYALSVGGAILDPALDVIEVIPVAPLSMTESLRPLILNTKEPIKIIVDVGPRDKISLKADGQLKQVISNTCNPDNPCTAEILIQQFEHKANQLVFNDWNFFEVLTSKLGWNSKI